MLGEAQAKLLGRVPATAHELAHDRYDGMQRLVAGDKVEAVDRLLDQRLTLNPDGIRYADYADARAHLTDTLHAGDVRSDPVSTADAHRAAADPGGWADRQVADAAARQVTGAAAAGAAAGATVAALLEAASQAARVRAGETSAAAAASSAAGSAARGAVRSGAAAGLGEALRVAAAAGTLPEGLAEGTLPLAVARAAVGVAEAGVAFARGDIDAGEFAARSCESTLRVTLVWACGAVGQTVLPVPVVGALVGGLVGQASATVIAQGLRFAVAEARADRLDEEKIALLEAEARTAVATAALLGEAEQALGEQRNAYVTATVGPLLDDALHAVATADPDDALKRLIELGRCFGGQPLFVTVEEFDSWMRDPLAALTLDPNWR